MASLLAPYIPDSSEWFKSAGQGYAQGEAIRNRNLRVDAGGQAAEGDLKGAKATLYEGGDFEGGNQVHQMMRQASDDALKKAENFHGTLGNLVLSVKSLPAEQQPAAWAKATQAAKSIGLDVSKYEDPSSMDAILAQSGKTMEAIGLENDRRKAMQPTYQHTEGGAFDPRSGTLTPYPGGMAVKRTDLERRAIAGGLQPGTPEYQDYVLSGPEKEARKSELSRRAEEAGLQPGSEEYKKYVLAGPPKTSTEKWNEGQSKAANFGNMMVQAEAALAAKAPKDADGKQLPLENPKGFVGAMREVLPEGIANQMRPEDYQVYKQSAEQWIRAKLRKESGAAIGKDEMDKEFTTYFPQYGDGVKVRQQKAEARAQATRGMIAESAGAYDHFFGQPKEQGQLPAEADAPTSREVVQVKSKQEYDALPPGTRYLAPDGSSRTKQ